MFCLIIKFKGREHTGYQTLPAKDVEHAVCILQAIGMQRIDHAHLRKNGKLDRDWNELQRIVAWADGE